MASEPQAGDSWGRDRGGGENFLGGVEGGEIGGKGVSVSEIWKKMDLQKVVSVAKGGIPKAFTISAVDVEHCMSPAQDGSRWSRCQLTPSC